AHPCPARARQNGARRDHGRAHHRADRAHAQRNRFLTREEAQRLVDAITVDENRTAANAILLLMLTGARRNEITQAKWEHVLWTERKLLVPLSKSGKPRWIALSVGDVAARLDPAA